MKDCSNCNGYRFVYGYTLYHFEDHAGYYPCPVCNQPQPLPDWMNPMGYDERLQGDGEGGYELVNDPPNTERI